MIKYDSFNPYIDGIFYRVTHNIGNVEVEHFKREYGTSNYTLKKLINLWLAYWNFSVIPLRISFFMGMFSAFAGAVIAILVVINKILHPDMTVGWSSTLCVMVSIFRTDPDGSGDCRGVSGEDYSDFKIIRPST